VTFRNWLAEQIGREKGRTIVNATGAGILHGPHVTQRALPATLASFEGRQVSLRSSVRHHHRPLAGERLLSAAKALRDELSGKTSMRPASEELLETWERFADGLSRERIARSLVAGLDNNEAPTDRSLSPLRKLRQTSQPARTDSAAPSFDAESLAPLAANLDLVWFSVPPVRMEAIAPKTRMFRCRTTTARLIGCAVRMPNPAVTEDGRPLLLGASREALQTGEYFIWRDEVYFTSTDDSDPRENGRTYAVLMPQGAAYLEQLPLHEILERRL
jgi:hypothetical protein